MAIHGYETEKGLKKMRAHARRIKRYREKAELNKLYKQMTGENMPRPKGSINKGKKSSSVDSLLLQLRAAIRQEIVDAMLAGATIKKRKRVGGRPRKQLPKQGQPKKTE